MIDLSTIVGSAECLMDYQLECKKIGHKGIINLIGGENRSFQSSSSTNGREHFSYNKGENIRLTFKTTIKAIIRVIKRCHRVDNILFLELYAFLRGTS